MYQKPHRTPSKNSPTRRQRSQSAPNLGVSAPRTIVPEPDKAPPVWGFDYNIADISINAPERLVSAPPTAPVEPQTSNWRRILADDKLNIVGENHKKSSSRRALEEKFVQELTGGKYYREREFKEADIDSEGNEKEGREPADPWDLRILHRVSFIRYDLKSLEEAKYFNKSDFLNCIKSIVDSIDGIYISVELVEEKFQGHTKTEQGLGLEADGSHWLERNGEQSLKDLRSEIDVLDGIIDDLDNIKDSISRDVQKDKDENEYRYRFGQLSLEDATTKLTLLAKRIEYNLNKIEEIVLRNNSDPDVRSNLSEYEVSELRSRKMAKEGNKRVSNAKGCLWMVGNEHVKHMKSYPDNLFHLVDEDEFESAFQQWLNESNLI